MRGSSSLAEVLAFALALSGCSFLLDFDELQKGKGGSGGSATAGASSGGAANLGGSSNPGGAGGLGGSNDAGAGGASCTCTDTDTDPCTVARCVDQGNGPVCVQEPREGLVLERDFTPMVAERYYQLAMVAGPSDFYLSSLSTAAGASNVTVYRFDASSTTIAPALDVNSLKLAGQPVSVPALAFDTTNGLRIHSYIGVRDAIGPGAKAYHVVFDADFKTQGRSQVSQTYSLSSSLTAQTLRPAALTAGDMTWGAWVNLDGTIGVTSAGLNPETLQFGALGSPASSLALVTTRGSRPAVLYTVDGAGVFLQSELGVTQLSECQTGAGTYYGAYAAPTSFTGLWAIGWTKSGNGFLTSEGTLGLCPANMPCGADPNCDANEANNLTRNPGVAAQHIQGDPPGVVYYLDVLPALTPISSTSLQASLSAWLFRIDFGSSPNLGGIQAPTAVGDPVLITTQATSAAASYRGPDQAAAAIIGDVAAVAWVEPTADGTDQVRVQRYKLCLPP